MDPGTLQPLWSKRYGQHFHDRNHPVRQSQHVFLSGSGTREHPAPCILEIGFGLGLNFRTTLSDCLQRGVPLRYLGLEHDPQPLADLSESARCTGQAQLLAWQQLLLVWPQSPSRVICPGVELEIRMEDASSALLPQGWASAIYLDGFSSAVNPELWSEGFIARLALALQPGGWLSTYSAAGHVRRALKAAGLLVERAPGWGSKREYLRAQRPMQHGLAP
jgi:tRNA U34 5-methylaminomethyl-2-thiouridine-forming methyltransferase MnmC